MTAQMPADQTAHFFCAETQGNAERPIVARASNLVSSPRKPHERDYCPNCCSQEPTIRVGEEVRCRQCDWVIVVLQVPRPAPRKPIGPRQAVVSCQKSAAQWFSELRAAVANAPEWRKA